MPSDYGARQLTPNRPADQTEPPVRTNQVLISVLDFIFVGPGANTINPRIKSDQEDRLTRHQNENPLDQE